MKNTDLTNHGSSLVPKPKMTDEELAKFLYEFRCKNLGLDYTWNKISGDTRRCNIEMVQLLRANKDII